MKAKKADKQWEVFGKEEPYFGVVTWEQFKPGRLDEKARADFFETGESFVQMVVGTITEHLDGDFNPSRCLDFGCGVGRLVVPLARRFERVTGVDVSVAMMEEAASNCRKYELDNVDFVQSDDTLSKVEGKYDFIHSYIVLQHIAPRRGEQLLKRMIELLEDEGVAALHFTYAKTRSVKSRLKYWLHTSVPLAHNLINLAKGRKFSYPYTLINSYNLNRLFEIVQNNGCEHAYLRFTNHDGLLGVIMMFQKKPVGIIY
jgi:2-polyprenyl-3-methyl-5-hydroxy-6-metoxy-1,4-benzoquinol methylase